VMWVCIRMAWFNISELSSRYIKDASEVVKAGQIVKVKVLSADAKVKRIALSMKALDERGPTPRLEPAKKEAPKPKAPSLEDKLAQLNSRFRTEVNRCATQFCWHPFWRSLNTPLRSGLPPTNLVTPSCNRSGLRLRRSIRTIRMWRSFVRPGNGFCAFPRSSSPRFSTQIPCVCLILELRGRRKPIGRGLKRRGGLPGRTGRASMAAFNRTGVIVPDSYDPKKPVRLDVILHGRGDTITEVSFLAGHQSDKPVPSDQNYIELEVFGRTNNAYRWGGETDVFEAMEAVAQGLPHRSREDRAARVLDGRRGCVAHRAALPGQMGSLRSWRGIY